MFGLGLGRSVQAYGYLPQAANDSIFAIYAEKFGFVGCVVLLAIFAALFSRVKRVAERAPDSYSRLVVLGVLVWVASEALINIGGMIGVMPMKGITLPFISYGGTSMIFSGAAVGLVFQVSRYTSFSSPRIRSSRKEKEYVNNANRRRVGRPYYAANSSRH
jgi:cell division protein FtsW